MASVRNSRNRYELHGVQSREMKLKSGIRRRRLLLVGASLGIGFATAGFVRYLGSSRSFFDTPLPTPKPPLSLQPSRFPCLDSLASERSKKRVVVLHGPDWKLDSTVELKCFPEREVVMSVEEGRHFLRQPIRQRIRFWIVQKGDAIYAKILDSSGSEKLDMDALDLVTNHKCGPRNGKNCHVQSARMVFRD